MAYVAKRVERPFTRCESRPHGRLFRREEAFSLIELMVTMTMIVLMLGITVVVWRNAARRTDLQAAVMMMQEDIRKTYSLADSGVAVTGSDGVKHRDQYRIEFHTNAENPASCYRIIKRTWDVGTNAYGAYTVVTPEKRTSIKILSNDWIKPSQSSDVQISTYSNLTQGNATNGWNTSQWGITFESKGSIIECDGMFTDKTVVMRSATDAKSVTTTVTHFGSVE